MRGGGRGKNKREKDEGRRAMRRVRLTAFRSPGSGQSVKAFQMLTLKGMEKGEGASAAPL